MCLCAIGVPVAESGVLSRTRFVNFLVGSHVFSVDVACQAGMDESVVEVGVELCNAAFVFAVHFDASQVVVPFPLGSCYHLVEIPSQVVGLQVFSGIFYGDIRECEPIEESFLLLGVECEPEARPGSFYEVGAGDDFVFPPDAALA